MNFKIKSPIRQNQKMRPLFSFSHYFCYFKMQKYFNADILYSLEILSVLNKY